MSKPIKVITSGLRTAQGGGGVYKPAPLATPEPISPINGQHFPAYPRTLTMTWKQLM